MWSWEVHCSRTFLLGRWHEHMHTHPYKLRVHTDTHHMPMLTFPYVYVHILQFHTHTHTHIYSLSPCTYVQTWDLLEIMYWGFKGLCEDFIATHPGYFISPLCVNGSAVESVFSCLKFITDGNLASTNYPSALTAFATQRDVSKNINSEAGYRNETINTYNV